MAKKRGPQSQLAAGMYALNQRRIQSWIPFLEDRVKELQTRLEQKQDAGKPESGEPGTQKQGQKAG